MMHIYKLDGNTMEIVSCPSGDIRKGDYIIIRDIALNRSLIVQVMNVGYANIPGILEDILRESSLENIEGKENDFLGIQAFADIIKDAKILRCKIRRAIIKGRLSHDISWTPSRSTSQLVTITDKAFLKLIGTPTAHAITLGTTKEGEDVNIDLSTIDGKLNIITGKKELVNRISRSFWFQILLKKAESALYLTSMENTSILAIMKTTKKHSSMRKYMLLPQEKIFK